MTMMFRMASAAVAVLLLGGCSWTPAPTADEARQFFDEASAAMLRLGLAASQAGWVYSTDITPDTEALSARASLAYIDAIAGYAKRAAPFDSVALSAEDRRATDLLKLSLESSIP